MKHQRGLDYKYPCELQAFKLIPQARAVARGVLGGRVINPPTFLKLTYSEIWVRHSENKGNNRLYSTNEIYLLNRKNIIKLYCQYKI